MKTYPAPAALSLALGRVSLVLGVVVIFLSYRYSLHLMRRNRTPMDHAFYRLFCTLLRVRVTMEGNASTKIPTLFVANHISYLDIPVLAATLNGRFVSKSEVAKWPLIGTLAKLHGTVFVGRKRGKADLERDQVQSALRAGHNLIMFPEGTTNDGLHIGHFKSSLFSAVIDGEDGATEDVTIQPVTLCFDTLEGIPLSARQRQDFAWIGDTSLFEHLMWALSQGKLQVRVCMGTPVPAHAFGSRKALALYCEDVVRTTLSAHTAAPAARLLQGNTGAEAEIGSYPH